MNITAYNHKLNQGVVKAMKGLTFDDCFLIERLNHHGTMGPSENCHRNVNNMIAEHGGTIVSGWRLYRDKELFENSTLKSFVPEVGSPVNRAAGGVALTVT